MRVINLKIGWKYMTQYVNIDTDEISKFSKLAKNWWDPKGPMGTLHTINPLRTKFITDNAIVNGRKILDVGCGGGILTESLAKAGALVTGIDLSKEALEIAKQHAKEQGLDIDYRFEDVEVTAEKHAGEFDVVTCMEVLEHIPDPKKTLAACSKALKPNGHAFFSTINRNLKSLLFAIIIGEYVLRLLTVGTHSYSKLIRPKELKQWGQDNDLEYSKSSSLIYNPFNKSFKVQEKEDVNYMVHFVKK